jgi:hypothetical protein
MCQWIDWIGLVHDDWIGSSDGIRVFHAYMHAPPLGRAYTLDVCCTYQRMRMSRVKISVLFIIVCATVFSSLRCLTPTSSPCFCHRDGDDYV